MLLCIERESLLSSLVEGVEYDMYCSSALFLPSNGKPAYVGSMYRKIPHIASLYNSGMYIHWLQYYKEISIVWYRKTHEALIQYMRLLLTLQRQKYSSTP